MVETLAEGDAKLGRAGLARHVLMAARWLRWVRSGSRSSVSLFTCETSSWPASSRAGPASLDKLLSGLAPQLLLQAGEPMAGPTTNPALAQNHDERLSTRGTP